MPPINWHSNWRCFLARREADVQGLPRLVECAEDKGIITGLRGVASWFPEGILHDAAFAGLDYLTLVFASCDPAEHNRMVAADGDQDTAFRYLQLCHEWEL